MLSTEISLIFCVVYHKILGQLFYKYEIVHFPYFLSALEWDGAVSLSQG